MLWSYEYVYPKFDQIMILLFAIIGTLEQDNAGG